MVCGYDGGRWCGAIVIVVAVVVDELLLLLRENEGPGWLVGWRCCSRHMLPSSLLSIGEEGGEVVVLLLLIDRSRKTPLLLPFVRCFELVMESQTISTFVDESACKVGLDTDLRVANRHRDYVSL